MNASKDTAFLLFLSSSSSFLPPLPSPPFSPLPSSAPSLPLLLLGIGTGERSWEHIYRQRKMNYLKLLQNMSRWINILHPAVSRLSPDLHCLWSFASTGNGTCCKWGRNEKRSSSHLTLHFPSLAPQPRGDEKGEEGQQCYSECSVHIWKYIVLWF